MQINLLSLFSSSPEAPSAEGGQNINTAGLQAAIGQQPLDGEPLDKFTELFQGKLAEIMPEGVPSQMQKMPTPKLMAALMQRLHLILPEGEAMANGASVAGSSLLPELTQEQIAAMAQVMGIDVSTLQLNMADSAQQIFPQADAEQYPIIAALVSAFKELAELGQKLEREGLILVDVSAEVMVDNVDGQSEGEAQKLSLLSLLASSDDAVQVLAKGDGLTVAQDLTVSEKAVVLLSQLFGVPESEISKNISDIKLVPAKQLKALLAQGKQIHVANKTEITDKLATVAKAPGLLQLLSRILNQPAGDVWQKLEDITDGEAELSLDMVMAAIMPEAQRELTGSVLDFDVSYIKAGGIVDEGLASGGKESNGYMAALDESGEPSSIAEILGAGISGQSDKILDIATAQDAASKPVDIAARAGRTIVNSDGSISASSFAATMQPAEFKQDLRSSSAITASAVDDSSDVDIAALPRKPERIEPVNNRKDEGTPSFVAQARKDIPNAAATPIRDNSIQPLLDESSEAPIEGKTRIDNQSTLALSASDSKLDFDSKLRERRAFTARDNVQAGSVREQVAVQVKKGIAKGNTTISIRLNPVELGRVNVRVEVNADGRTTLAVVADNRHTLELLQRDSGSLEKSFADLGMDMSEGGMSFDLNEQFAGGQQENESEQQPKTLQSSFDAMLGDNNHDNMMAEALLDSPHMNYTVGVDDGLNIKV